MRRWAGKQKGLGSIPLRLSFLFKVVVVGSDFVTLPLTINYTLNGFHCGPCLTQIHPSGDGAAVGIILRFHHLLESLSPPVNNYNP